MSKMSIMDLWEKQDEEEKKIVEWLKLNREHLSFSTEMKDQGFAFAEEVVVTDERNGVEAFKTSFYGMGEAERFIDDIHNC